MILYRNEERFSADPNCYDIEVPHVKGYGCRKPFKKASNVEKHVQCSCSAIYVPAETSTYNYCSPEEATPRKRT
jgi:hypothetical protein